MNEQNIPMNPTDPQKETNPQETPVQVDSTNQPLEGQPSTPP